MISTIRRLPARSALVGLALAVVAGVLPGLGAAAQYPADPPPDPAPASAKEPSAPEKVVLRVDAPVVSEKGGSVTLVGVTASFPDGSGVMAEDMAVSVTVGAADDTAVGSTDGSEADYMNIEGFEITIPAGESSVSTGGFVLTVTDDDLAEGFETLTVAGSTAAAGIESVGGTQITIVDDDAVVVLSADSDPGEGVSTRVAEGEVSQVAVSAELPAGVVAERDLTVSLSTGAEGDLAVGSATGAAADYAAAEGWEVTIPAGEGAAVGAFQLAVSEDKLAEGDETLTVGGEVATAAGAGMAVIGASLTIADGDDEIILGADADPGEAVSTRVAEGSTSQVAVSAELPAGASAERDVTVSVSVGAESDSAVGSADGAGADYAAVDDFAITIPAGAGRGAGSFTLATADDDTAGEGEESVTVRGTAAGFTVASAMVSILDGDEAGAGKGPDKEKTPGLDVPTEVVAHQMTAPDKVLLSADISEAEEGAASAPTITVTASFPDGTATLTTAVTVTVSVGKSGDTATGSADGSGADYTDVANFNLEIPAGSSSVAHATGFTLTVTDDMSAEGDETLTITGFTAAAGITAVEEAKITITDDADSTITLTVDTDYLGPSTFNEVGEVGNVRNGPYQIALAVDADLPTGITAARDLPVYFGLGAAGDGAVGSETGAGADYRNIGLYGFSNTIVAGRSGFAGYNLVFQSTNDDLAGEGRESVSVTGRVLMLPSLAEIDGFTVASGEFYITDTDVIPDIIYNVSPVRVSEAASSPQITVTATYEVSTLQVVADVTVSITAGKTGDSASWMGTGADYALPTIPDITLAAGVKTGQTQFNLSLTNDTDVEGDEIITLNIGAQAPGRGFSEADGVITIVDDDGLITLSLSSTSLGEESGTTGVVVTASMPTGVTAPATGITVSVTAGQSGDSATGSADGTGADYTNLTIPAITIASGSSSSSAASQNLTITSDDLAEGDETITFTGTVTTPSSSSYRVSEAQLTITDDDDVITLSVDPSSVAENAGSVPVTVTAALASGKTAAANFALMVSVGKDGDTATGSRDGSGADYANVDDLELDISGGASQGTVDFTLAVTDDPDWEGSETSSLTLVGTLSTFTINEPVITITGDNDLNPAACGDGTYVDDASTQTGLASDCRALVNIRNHWVSTSANYDWPADHPVLTWGGASTTKIQNWEGVTRTDTDSGTPVVWRVTRLEMLDETVARLDPDDPDTAITENFQRPGWSVYGILPASIGDLTALEYLHLNNNRLLGSIPTEIGDLANLSELYLHGNLFFSVLPDELGSLTNLTELLMTDNLLRGGIPSALGSLTNLTKLWLDDNLLSGTLPTQLGSLTNLEELHLQQNLLSGAIPTQLANLTNLIELILSDNYSTSLSPTLRRFIYASGFTGSIPKELGRLSNLEKLYLDDNVLTGAIPAELGNLNQLDELWLEDNALSGPIPAELGNLSSLTGLDLSKNLLTSIPDSLGDLSNLEYLTLDRNRISSVPAGLGRLSNLESLILSDNLLTGTLPAELGNLAPAEGGSLRVLYIHNPGPLGPLPEPLLSIRWIDLFAYDDPLDLIAFYEFGRRLGTSPRNYEVWTCDVGGPYDITPQAATSLLNVLFTDFFRQMSDGKFTLRFTVGGAVVASPLPATGVTWNSSRLAAPRKSCRDQIRPDRDSQGDNRDTNRRIIIIDNAGINDGFNQQYYLLKIGAAVPPGSPGYQELTTDSIVHVGGSTITGARPRLSTVAHEIGHDIQWPHSYGGRFVRTNVRGREVWEYDNLMDLMSGRLTYNLTTGTIAVNYYSSGWIEPEEVAVHTGAGASYELSPTGEGGTQMLVLPTSWGPGVFYALGVRTQQGFDRDVPEEGVELYYIDQRRNSCQYPFAGACGNIRRRVQPVNAPNRDLDSRLFYTIENVFDVGDDFTLNVGLGVGESNRLPVEVTGREGNKFTVRVADLPFTPVSSRSILGLPEQINVSVNVAGGATVTEGQSRRVTVTAAYPPSSRTSRYEAEVLMSVGGSATAGTDFTALNNFNVTIPEGASQASRTFMLQTTNDNLREEQETITLSFQAPGYELTGRRSVTLTIPRNDQPPARRPTPQPTPTPSGGGGGGGGGSSPPPVTPPPTTPPPTEPPAPACQGRFCDDDGSVHQANIERIAQWEITLGCDAEDAAKFCPSAQITRRQMAAFLYRAVSQRWTIEAPEEVEITDVPADAWYRTYADWVVSVGAFAAPDGIFNPGGIVTRADMAVMMVAAFPHLESVAEAEGLFNDVEDLDPAIVRAIEGMYGRGVTRGCAATPLNYCPDNPVTRAQMASFFVRAIDLVPAAGDDS